MIEPFTYLYYRCYRLYGKNNAYPGPYNNVLFALMLYINTASLTAVIQWDFPSDVTFCFITFVTLIIMLLFSFNQKKIVKKYESLNKKQKKIGNIVFIVEIFVTIVSLLVLIWI